MDNIKVGVYSEHRVLLDGICQLIDNTEGIQIMLKENSIDKLLKCNNLLLIKILIINPQILDSGTLDLTIKINTLNPKIRILILSIEENEINIIETIKAGAMGFLAKDSDRNDLLEAVYTLHSGYDYYSKSITQILLKKYISNLQSDNSQSDKEDVDCLSLRELEILKLWGNSYSNKEISEELFISVRTVESHKNHIMNKLNLKTTVDLVKFAIRNNIIEI